MSERQPDSSTAVLFQGQGHQYPGMGRETYDKFPEVRRIYEEASEALDLNVAKLCFEDFNSQLQQSEYAQPAVLTTELADYTVYERRFGIPGHLAGHSLGEFTAIVASGSIDFAEGVKIVRERGKMMDEVSLEKPGAMAVVFGIAREKLAELRDRYGVEVANDNSRDQRVIAGLKVGVEAARQQIREWGGKFKLLDNIHVASHCSQMDEVRDRLGLMLDGVEINWPPNVPFVSNVTADYVLSAQELRSNLSKQVARTVEWYKSIINVRDHGAENFVEIGPKKVLATMIERDHPDVGAKHFKELDIAA